MGPRFKERPYLKEAESDRGILIHNTLSGLCTQEQIHPFASTYAQAPHIQVYTRTHTQFFRNMYNIMKITFQSISQKVDIKDENGHNKKQVLY